MDSYGKFVIIIDKVKKGAKFGVKHKVIFSENSEVSINNTGIYPISLKCQGVVDLKSRHLMVADGEGFVTIKPGQCVQVNSSSNNAYLIPGVYPLFCNQKEIDLICKPLKNIKPEAIGKMVAALEGLESSISINLSYRTEETNSGAPELLALAEILKRAAKKLPRFSYNAINNLDFDYRTSYRVDPVLKRQDKRSIRANLMYGNRQNRYVNMVKEFTYDTKANSVLKAQTYLLIRKLRHLLEKLDEDKNKISYSGAVGYEELIEETKESCSRCLAILKEFYNSQALQDVPLIPENANESLYDYPECRYISLLTAFLNEPKELRVSGGFAQRRNSDIFEKYGLVLIDCALRKLGFSLANKTAGNFIDFEQNNSAFIYTKGDDRIFVHYGLAVQHYRSEKPGNFVYINSQHVQPDFMVTHVSPDQKEGKALVVEMKYRSPKNILSDDINPRLNEDIADTLDDYMQFGYLNIDGNLQLGCVSGVYLLYPLENEAYKAVLGNIIFYLGIDPMIEPDDQKSVSALVEGLKKII